MFRFLKNVILFLLVCLFLYIPLLCLWGEFAPQNFKKNISFTIGGVGHLFTRLQEVKTIKNNEILVLGSSLAYRGFDPRIFEKHNLNLFNLGSSAQTPIQTEVLLNRYLDHLNPKIVILEVNPWYFSNDGVESSLDLFSNDFNDIASINSAFKINNLKTYNALIFGIYKDFTDFKITFKEPLRKGEDLYISHGYVEKDLRFNKDHSVSNLYWEFNNNQIRAFENILYMLKKKHIAYFLVQTPITNLRYDHIINKISFDDFITKHGTYYNFNTLITLNDSLHFYDSHHLNQNGVVVFNEYLLKILLLDDLIK